MSLINLRHAFKCGCAWRLVTQKGLDVSRRADRCSVLGEKLNVSVWDPQVMLKPTFFFQQWGGRGRHQRAWPYGVPLLSVKPADSLPLDCPFSFLLVWFCVRYWSENATCCWYWDLSFLLFWRLKSWLNEKIIEIKIIITCCPNELVGPVVHAFVSS